MRRALELLGYNLGTYNDWDGDFDQVQYLDWRPDHATDLKIVVPNSRGLELMLIIDMVGGEVEIQDFDDENGSWVTLLKTTWRELVGHKLEKFVTNTPHFGEPPRRDRR